MWDVQRFGANSVEATKDGVADVGFLCIAVLKYGPTFSGAHHVKIRVVDNDGHDAFSVRQPFDAGREGAAGSSLVPLWIRFDAEIGRYEIRASLDNGQTLDHWPFFVNPPHP